MSGKITTAEFQDWNQKLDKITKEILQSGVTFITPQFEKEWIETQGLSNFYVKNKVCFAVLASLYNLALVMQENVKKPLTALGGLTFSQWGEQVVQRLKEQSIAEGYYNPANSLDLTFLKEQRNTMLDKLMGANLSSLLNYANSEEYESITNYAIYLKELEKISPGVIEKVKNLEPELETSFLIVDMAGRVEKLDNLLKQANKPRPSTPTPNSPPSPSNSSYSTNLENEITDLKSQVRQLEEKNKDNSSVANPIEKEFNQKLLEDIKKRLGDKEKEFQKIQKPDQKDKPNNNLPLIIGVSAAAIGFLLIIIIVLLARPSRRRD